MHMSHAKQLQQDSGEAICFTNAMRKNMHILQAVQKVQAAAPAALHYGLHTP
jgi:hypothetical protein